MKSKKLIAVICCLALCLAATACGSAEPTEAETAPAVVAEVAPADEAVVGSVVSDTGSSDDYIGYYNIAARNGDFPYDSLEIIEGYSDSMYFYTDNSFASCYIDYSEQRALNGNSLMVIELDINDVDAEFAVNPINQDGAEGLELVGQGAFEGMGGTFLKNSGTADSEEEAPAEDSTEDSAEDSTEALASGMWESLDSSFTRDDSDQYNSGVLNLEYAGDDGIAFEMLLMQGSEDEGTTSEISLYGYFTVYEEDRAVFEETDDNGNTQTIYLILTQTEDEFYADVTSFGDFEISPDGCYIFTENFE